MSWFWDNFGGVITTVLAIYGAFLSSLNFWHMWKRDKKKLVIKAYSEQVSPSILANVTITVVNESLRPITINDMGLKYDPLVEKKLLKPYSKNHYSEPLPIKLETSDQVKCTVACLYYADENEQSESIDVIAVPYAIDTEGQRYEGAPFKHQVYFTHGF